MTRINVVSVTELSDQWLLAEYRELPRVVKQDISIEDAPDRYCLGKGHVKWARKHLHYILWRYHDIVVEMRYRGFKTNYSFSELRTYALDKYYKKLIFGEYYIDINDIAINRQRLIEKYRLKPNYYRWTNRTKPEWLN